MTDQKHPKDKVTLSNILTYTRMHASVGTSPREFVAGAVEELHKRWNERDRQPPAHLPDQRDLLADALEGDDPAWVIFFDAARYDSFVQLVPEYFEGTPQPVWNGGVGYTGDWCERNLAGEYPNAGFFSWVPIHGFTMADWDERDHFAIAPRIHSEFDMHEQLAALGYRESADGDPITEDHTPAGVNQSVRDNRRHVDGGVIRYVKPHPPFAGLEELTSENTKTLKTRRALDSGELTYQELYDAYERTFHQGLRAAARLVPELDGTVILTADHGTCLYCGQLFHGRNLDKHDHLCVVPWMVVE